MPLRKPTVKRTFDFATLQRRRNLKTPRARDREATRVLNKVLKETGGRMVEVEQEEGENEFSLFGLTFADCGLTSLPVEIFEDEFLYEKCEQQLTSLDVSGNSISRLDAEIGDFIKLRHLNCSKNKLSVLPPSICQLESLVQLRASDNRITALPRNVHKCASLVLLYADYNRLKSLPINIGLTPELKLLEVSHNQLRKLPVSIYQIKKVINVSFNSISRLPEPETKGAKCEKQTLRSLIATNNSIENIPEYIGNVRWLQSINLCSNRVVDVPPGIGQLRYLISLNLYENRIQSLPDSMGALESLRVLDVRNNEITKLPESMSRLSQLVTIDCAGNKIENIPEELKEIKSLQSADFSDNDIRAIPELGDMPKLVTIDISQNSIEEVADFGEMAMLANLNLSSNQIKKIPSSISNLKSLENFQISDNKIEELPKEIGKLKSVSVLNLTNNELDSLTSQVRKLRKLRSLKVSNNNLSALPQPLGFLHALRDADVAENELTTVVGKGPMPRGLRQFSAQGNKLGASVSTKFFNELRRLTRLDLSNAALVELPDSIGKLRWLEELNLSNNDLKSMPETADQLHEMRTLDVSQNRVEKLPEHVEKWRHLVDLDLSKNRLTELPENMCMIPRLETLFVSENELSSVDPRVLTMATIKVIRLNDNQLEDIPKPVESTQSLVDLDVSGNKLGEIMTELEGNTALLSSVSRLNCSKNQIRSLPADLYKLRRMEVFKISRNFYDPCVDCSDSLCLMLENLTCLRLDSRIEKLPREIERMRLLKELDISYNFLKTVPAGLAKCRSLTAIDISGNRIMQLPNVIFKMKRLVTLKADDNPLTITIPQKFAPREPAVINDPEEEEELVEVDINSLPINERLQYVGKTKSILMPKSKASLLRLEENKSILEESNKERNVSASDDADKDIVFTTRSKIDHEMSPVRPIIPSLSAPATALLGRRSKKRATSNSSDLSLNAADFVADDEPTTPTKPSSAQSPSYTQGESVLGKTVEKHGKSLKKKNRFTENSKLSKAEMLLQKATEEKVPANLSPSQERTEKMRNGLATSPTMMKEKIVMNYTTEDLCPISAISSSSMDSISSQQNMLVNA